MKFKKLLDTQFLYKNKWVDKLVFKAVLYDSENKRKLANSYEEYQNMMESGKWFNDPQVIVPKKVIRKRKNVSNS